MATKASATADNKLNATLSEIAAIEAAEKQAAQDAYRKLVSDAADDGSVELSAAQVVAILRRAGRSAEDLRADAALEKELVAAKAEAGTFEDRTKATASAREKVAAAEREYQEAMRRAIGPIDAAKNLLDVAQEQELAARQAKQRVIHLKAEQAKRELARSPRQDAGE